MGQNMFRLKDRKGAELCLAMTHEEVMTTIARSELRSYKQLPQIWYQIQTKFRDEPRPKSGLLRVRQFLMKDAYSFDIDEAGLDASYAKHDAVYRRIFTRCGLEFVAVEADSGAMGGSQSQEFMVYTDAGEDLIASSSSGYAANVEKAASKLPVVEDLAPTGDGTPELVHTPGQKTIDEVGAYLGVAPVHQIKTMAYIVEHPDSDDKQVKTVGKTRAVVVFLRGDHQINETKLSAIAGGELRPMQTEEIVATFNAPAGYLGPIGLTAAPHPRKPGILVILDTALEGRTNLIAGANKEEYHLRNVTPLRDFKPTLVADVRSVNEGEPDPIAGEPLRIGKAVEIGHIFKLGYKYSEVHGRVRPESRRQGDYPHHGQLRHRHRAHPDRRYRILRCPLRRAESVRHLRPAAVHRAVPGGRHHHQRPRAGPSGGGRSDRRAAHRGRIRRPAG